MIDLIHQFTRAANVVGYINPPRECLFFVCTNSRDRVCDGKSWGVTFGPPPTKAAAKCLSRKAVCERYTWNMRRWFTPLAKAQSGWINASCAQWVTRFVYICFGNMKSLRNKHKYCLIQISGNSSDRFVPRIEVSFWDLIRSGTTSIPDFGKTNRLNLYKPWDKRGKGGDFHEPELA